MFCKDVSASGISASGICASDNKSSPFWVRFVCILGSVVALLGSWVMYADRRSSERSIVRCGTVECTIHRGSVGKLLNAFGTFPLGSIQESSRNCWAVDFSDSRNTFCQGFLRINDWKPVPVARKVRLRRNYRQEGFWQKDGSALVSLFKRDHPKVGRATSWVESTTHPGTSTTIYGYEMVNPPWNKQVARIFFGVFVW
jgi:hypothetical protein